MSQETRTRVVDRAVRMSFGTGGPVWEPEVSRQGLWGLSGLGTQGAVHGGAEGVDHAGVSGAGQLAGGTSSVRGLDADIVEVDSKSKKSSLSQP